MNTNKLVPLFLCSFAILFVGFGLFPLLPVYATEFGASPSQVGIYLALIYIAISLGNLLPGWSAEHISRKALFVTAGLIGAPALFLLGQATQLWQVVLLTSVVWFTGGIGLSLISVFVSLYSDKGNRGRWFSLIALTTPLGAVIGGSVVGWIVAWQGYALMFALVALVYAIWPFVGFWKVEDQPRTNIAKSEVTRSTRIRLGKSYHALLLTVLLSAITMSIVRMGLSLSMKDIHFSLATISLTNVIGGLITIPVVLGFGVLSDRLGRRAFLISAYLLSALSGVILISADQLWHFWIVASAVLVSRSINGSLASALATDILPPEAVGRGLPLLGTMNWASGVLGFAGSGYIIDTLGSQYLYLIATLLSLLAAILIALPSGQNNKASIPQVAQRLDCITPSVK